MIPINDQQLYKLLNKRLLIEDRTNQYILLADVPSRFGYGYNSFLIGVHQGVFMPGTYLHVLFVDASGKRIPIDVTQYQQNRLIRCSIQIKQSDSIGFGKLLVCGALHKTLDGSIISKQNSNRLNVRHIRDIYINGVYPTPSPLRFKQAPTATVELQPKGLFDYDIRGSEETFTISQITIDKSHPRYYCLQIDKSAEAIDTKSSIYNEKFLTYQTITTSISDISEYNQIFKGQQTDKFFIPGNYVGVAQMLAPPDNVYIQYGDIKLYNCTLDLGKYIPKYEILRGENVATVSIDQYILPGSKDKRTKRSYDIYAYNSQSITIDTLSNFDGIKMLKFTSTIQSASGVYLQTNYFNGHIITPESKVYAQSFIITSAQNTIYGYNKIDQIKNTTKIQIIPLQVDTLYDNYQFSGSCSFISYKYTRLQNCGITDSVFDNEVSGQVASCSTFKGSLYSARIMTQPQDTSEGNSYISGSISGQGSLIPKYDTNVTYKERPTIMHYTDQQTILQHGGAQFSGSAYNVQVQASYYNGTLYNASWSNELVLMQTVYDDVIYKQCIISANAKTKLIMNNISTLQMFDNGSDNYPETFSIALNPTNDSYLKFKSTTLFKIQLAVQESEVPSKIDGYFTIGDTEPQVGYISFSGSYQKLNNTISQDQSLYYQIQKYELDTIKLSPTYERYFNTRQIFIFNQQYDKLYIPIARVLNSSIYSPSQLLKLLPTRQISINYTYKHAYKTPTVIKYNTTTIPINLYISNVNLISGHLNSVQLYYNNTDTNNYQLISTIQINDHSELTGDSITRSLDLPTEYFNGQSNRLLIKYKDFANKYSEPEQHNTIISNYKIDANQYISSYVLNNVNKVTNVSSVRTINSLTGDVELTPYNIPYISPTAPVRTYNVGSLIDTYIDGWTYDAGILTSPSITTNSQGSLLLGPAQYLVYSSSNYTPPLYRCSVSNVTQFVTQSVQENPFIIPNDAVTYIKYSYQNGIFCDLHINDINMSNVIPILTVYRTGSMYKYVPWGQSSKGVSEKLTCRLFRTRGFEAQPGGILLGQSQSTPIFGSSNGPPHITITSGYVWHGTSRIYLPSINSINDQTSLYYSYVSDSKIMWSNFDVTSYNNTQYNGSSGLQAADWGDYLVNWIYRFISSGSTHTAIILGSTTYESLQQAQWYSEIPDLPKWSPSQAMLIGRSIIQYHARSSSLIQTAVDISYDGSSGNMSGGTGVSDVSVQLHDGIYGSVHEPTTTPTIILSLGNITPNNIDVSGNITSSGILSQHITTSGLQVSYINGTASNQFGIGYIPYQFKFSNPKIRLVGSPFNTSITWSINNAYNETATSYYTLSYATYPYQNVWTEYESGSLELQDLSLTLMNASKSTRLTINVHDGDYIQNSGYAYIFFRNYIYCGTSSINVTNEQQAATVLSSIQNKSLLNTYETKSIVSPSVGQYIYFACPSWMTQSSQPLFVVNDVAGGFTNSIQWIYDNGSYSQQYVLYRSYNSNLGTTMLTVKDFNATLNNYTYSIFTGESGGDISNHNVLQGLQGGLIDQRYHINSDMYSTLSNYSHSELNGLLGAGQYHISLAQYNQLRQYFISLSQPDPTSGSNGDIWLVYQE